MRLSINESVLNFVWILSGYETLDTTSVNGASAGGGFCKPHSTETTILWVINYHLIIAYSSKCSVLSLLDLSPPSDVINHVIIIDRLGNKVGISRALMGWLLFHPSNRNCLVSSGDYASSCSLLGPKLFYLTFGSSYLSSSISFNCFASSTQCQLVAVSCW